MGKTSIEWTEMSWNPVTGCTKVSEGCRNCYAERMSKRLAGRCGYPPAPHNFDVTLHPERLEEPLHWHKPRRVFVCSMSDLFHEDVPYEFVEEVFGIIGRTSQHTYQILTKRPKQMDEITSELGYSLHSALDDLFPNVWLGVTVENQKAADERIPILLQTPAAVRFVSVEPMLGPVDLMSYLANNSMWKASQWNPSGLSHAEEQADGRSLVAFSKDGIKYEDGVDLHWVICGGESGPGARPMHPDWARSLRDQCQTAGIPFFFKQWGEWKWYEGPPVSALYPQGTGHYRVGKKAAGRLLDGREWNEMPQC